MEYSDDQLLGSYETNRFDLQTVQTALRIITSLRAHTEKRLELLNQVDVPMNGLQNDEVMDFLRLKTQSQSCVILESSENPAEAPKTISTLSIAHSSPTEPEGNEKADEEGKNPDESVTLMEQIRKTIDLHFNPEKVVEKKNKRGRPEDVKDTRPIVLMNLLNRWEAELDRRLTRDQRSDAQFASVGRYIKKLPDIFLKYVGSKCQYKSR